MRAKSLVLFVIAVGCGLAASIGVSQYMENASGNVQQVETAKILVAMIDVNIGEKLDAQTVKLEEWPKDRVPEGAIYELTDVEGKFPRTRMYAGEPILQAKLMGSNNSSATQTIPKGFRVVSIKASVENAGGGLIQPGDRVDVLVLLRKSAEVPETGTRTILKDVNVFSVDGATERSVDEDGRSRALSTVSLLLKPRQAEAAMLASELGRLFLTLRRPDDDVEDTDEEGETVKSLLGTAGETANDRVIGQNDGFNDWLTGASTPPPVTETVADIVEPIDTTPKWKMVILGSTGSREFLWSDEKELPSETGVGANNGGYESAAAALPTPSTRPQPRVRPTTPTEPPTIDNDGDGSPPSSEPGTEEDIPISPH
ncbi:MAG TPA: Flp pilus assembly protein CpaB [Pirellulaceae bacterium]|nr:Flp pilus assembly protein CpaB [Planctomycetales bacterium]MCB9937294.1 Flp pilus assembly protein CpaB [Planctomycetaceae bacterium]HRX80264.1 Flp pilus assembly protein CpaB [Pirellulaceae bacterium]